MEEVFEPVQELCQQHGIAFEVVDLRWGKTEQYSINKLSVCIFGGEVVILGSLECKINH